MNNVTAIYPMDSDKEGVADSPRGSVGRRLSVSGKRRARHKFKELAFDWSFTSQDFRDMDMTRVDAGVRGGAENEEADDSYGADSPSPTEAEFSEGDPPRLRFGIIHEVKSFVKDNAERGRLNAESLRAVLSSPGMAGLVFELMDFDGDGEVDAASLEERMKSGDAYKDQNTKLFLDQHGMFLDFPAFQHLWREGNLFAAVEGALESPTVHEVMEALISFTNER